MAAVRRGERNGQRRGERGEPRKVGGRRRCGRCAAEDALSGGEVGVKLLHAAAAEAGRWATRDLFRQAGKCHREGFFFHGKKDMADGAFFNADPAANDLVKRLVTVP